MLESSSLKLKEVSNVLDLRLMRAIRKAGRDSLRQTTRLQARVSVAAHVFFCFFCCIFDNHTCIFCSLYSEPWNVSFGFPLKVYRISKPYSKTNTR